MLQYTPMIDLILAIGPIFILLVVSEFLWRTKKLRGEAARKFLHILIGSYVAFWPFFMAMWTIQLISLALLVVVYISHRYHIFHAINGVKRHTWGDVLYALGIGLTATVTKNPWIFTIAILHMSLADGLAGLVGSQWGKRNSYKVLGFSRSLIGTGTFIVVSYAILVATIPHQPLGMSVALMAALPFMAAAVENLGILGIDNVLVPLLVVAVFSLV